MKCGTTGKTPGKNSESYFTKLLPILIFNEKLLDFWLQTHCKHMQRLLIVRLLNRKVWKAGSTKNYKYSSLFLWTNFQEWHYSVLKINISSWHYSTAKPPVFFVVLFFCKLHLNYAWAALLRTHNTQHRCTNLCTNHDREGKEKCGWPLML